MAWSRRDVLRAGAVGLGAGLIGGREVLADPPPKKVLEVFCIGAMDPRHHLFGMCEVTQGGVAWPARLRAAPSDATPFPFAAGNPVLRVGGLNFGRAAWPLLPMAHRIRVVGMRHDIGA
ncbi:MAG TPA: twin-arginine translocation signal domain-containing protein, partial [Myxococcota bacterium]|nr:twin-arginine translocation signal domain-containing protein [Myxococcota bacterium]